MSGCMNAIHYAFNHHRHLILSASDFLLMISQGLSIHISKHAEELRKYFVNHEGQEDIVIDRDENFLQADDSKWISVFEEFSTAIKDRIKADICDVMIDDFETATANSRVASQVAIMDSMSNYFKFRLVCKCGFPKITLKGTV